MRAGPGGIAGDGRRLAQRVAVSPDARLRHPRHRRTKVAFIGWGIGIESLDFTGLSGHSALSVYLFACAAYFITVGAAPRTRVPAIAAGVAAALLVAVSRLILRRHSPSEVVAGFAFGSVLAALLFATTRPAGTLRLSRTATALVLLALVVAAHGHEAPSQHLLTRSPSTSPAMTGR